MLLRTVPLSSVFVGVAIASIGACDPSPPSGSGAPAAETSAPAASRSAAKAPLIEWAPAPPGELAPIVKAEVERAKKDGRALLVYVGASWCEPCQRFHQAAVAGEITGDLPPIRMLELDLDRDAERLAAAGYASRLIPLFAVPGPEGQGTDVRIEGSIKGAGAVGDIVPRLRGLLARAGASRR